MAETDILSGSETNGAEIMEFTIYGELYGINVTQICEVMMPDKVKPIPHAHPFIEGIFKPRDLLLTVIDLPRYLTGKMTEIQSKDLFIISNINKRNLAFRVHSVVGISHISGENIQKPEDSMICKEGVTTGIAQCGSDLVTILDLEKITAEIMSATGIQLDEVSQLGQK